MIRDKAKNVTSCDSLDEHKEKMKLIAEYRETQNITKRTKEEVENITKRVAEETAEKARLEAEERDNLMKNWLNY